MSSLPATAAAVAVEWSSLRPLIRYLALRFVCIHYGLEFKQNYLQARAAIPMMHDSSLGGRLIFVREDR
jgi:hypothetical protein